MELLPWLSPTCYWFRCLQVFTAAGSVPIKPWMSGSGSNVRLPPPRRHSAGRYGRFQEPGLWPSTVARHAEFFRSNSSPVCGQLSQSSQCGSSLLDKGDCLGWFRTWNLGILPTLRPQARKCSALVVYIPMLFELLEVIELIPVPMLIEDAQ